MHSVSLFSTFVLPSDFCSSGFCMVCLFMFDGIWLRESFYSSCPCTLSSIFWKYARLRFFNLFYVFVLISFYGVILYSVYLCSSCLKSLFTFCFSVGRFLCFLILSEYICCLFVVRLCIANVILVQLFIRMWCLNWISLHNICHSFVLIWFLN